MVSEYQEKKGVGFGNVMKIVDGEEQSEGGSLKLAIHLTSRMSGEEYTIARDKK